MEYIVEESPAITFEEIEKMPRREAIITIADTYSDIFLYKYSPGISKYLIERDIFDQICRRLKCNSADFYKFCFFKLMMVGMRNGRPKDNEYVDKCPPDESIPGTKITDAEKIEELKIKDLNEKAFYTGTDVWKILAYYCKNLSPAAAKNILLKIEKYHDGKKYDMMKEVFTSTLVPDGLKYLPFIVEHKISDGIYTGSLAGKRGNLINPHINIFVNKELEIGKTYLGVKKQPHRNIIINIIE